MIMIDISILFVFLASSVSASTPKATFPVTPERKLQNSSKVPPGIWTSRGYGIAFNVPSSSDVTDVTAYQETNISCIPSRNDTILLSAELLDNGTIAAILDGGHEKPILYDKTGSFQSGCANGVTPELGDSDYHRDALEDFDILDQTFAENYAFFELRNVDWDTLTAGVRATLTSNSTDPELFSSFMSLLEPLNDTHVTLQTNDDDFRSHPWEIEVQFAEEAVAQGAGNVEEYASMQFDALFSIISSYMNGGLNQTVDGTYFGRFVGTNIGYMYLLNFAADDHEAFAESLDQVFLALAGSNGMVIDVRANGGGYPLNALLLASHFTSERKLVYTFRAVDGDGYTNKTEVFFEAGEEAYRHTGPVIVLTSAATVSSGEIFVLAMSQLPQTTRLGRHTVGAFSGILHRTLPNGWHFGLSNEVTAAPDGTVYEMIGIPPELVPVTDVFPLADRKKGIDSWLDLALQHLEATSSPEPSSSPVRAATTETPVSQTTTNDGNSSDVPPGIWTSRGYGIAFNATSSRDVTAYQETNISCFPSGNDTVILSVELLDKSTIAVHDGYLIPKFFDSTGSFQSGCANGVTPKLGDSDYDRDALVDFDILYQTFAENYAFFELRNVDWDTLTAGVRATLTSNSTDQELFSAFMSILEPLNDTHVSIQSNDDTFSSHPWEIVVQLAEEAVAQGAGNVEEYVSMQFYALLSIISSYMEGGLNQTLNQTVGETGVDEPTVYFGRFVGTNIGYMNLFNFFAEDHEAFAESLDEVFLALAGSSGMVIDVRANEGGYPLNALLLASHFTPERKLAFTTRAVDGDGYTNKTEVYFEAGEETYRHTGPVIVLTSGATISSGEIFLLAMSQLPQTTRLGRHTVGAFSSIFGRTLPNGWHFGLSNEVTAAPDGTVYEMIGIPPELVPEAAVFPLADREKGIDSWLDLALQHLETTSTAEPSSLPVRAATTETPVSQPTTNDGTAPVTTKTSGAADAFAFQCFAAVLVAAATLLNS